MLLFCSNYFKSPIIDLFEFKPHEYALPTIYENKIEASFSTDYLYELNYRYLILECWNDLKTIFYGYYTISLHNLLSGDRSYDIKLIEGDNEDDVSIHFNFDFTKKVKCYLEFDNISITNTKNIQLEYQIYII